MLPFVELLQFREPRPYIRYAHYTRDPMKVPARYIRDNEIIYIDQGRGNIHTELGSFPYREKSMFLIAPGLLHSFEDDEPERFGHAHWAIHFDWDRQAKEAAIRIVGDKEGPVSKRNELRKDERLESIWLPDIIRFDDVSDDILDPLRRLVDVYTASHPLRKLELHSLLLQTMLAIGKSVTQGTARYELLTNLAGKNPKPHKERSGITRFIVELHKAVEDSPCSDSVLQQWKEMVHFSPAQFHRLFKLQTGYAPHAYLTLLRMEKASRLLLSTDLPVQEIAFACGYDDAKYFCRLFRRAEGTSPSDYRKSFRIGTGSI